MPSDYDRICRDNRRAYGEIGATKFGRHTSEQLYADRTHFIYELLQNAEDALGRRSRAWTGKREVMFHLATDRLIVEHYGDPFTEADVKAICEFNESTKQESLTEIGRFGIGFKSVYAYTDDPHIHSGDEHFAIHDFIYPKLIRQPQDIDPDTTSFILRFRRRPSEAYREIVTGFATLNRRTLLFLKNLDGILWSTASGEEGLYLRDSRIEDEAARRITLVSKHPSDGNIGEEEWLVFSRAIINEGHSAGEVQVAVLLDGSTDQIQVARNCTLFARFATGLETHLGLLIDGPYRTTASRDEIPSSDAWNQHLVAETAGLLVEGLRWLRDRGILDATALRCLPLAPPEDNSCQVLLQPLFEETRRALRSEPLLPRHGGGYISANRALLARSDGLRQVFSSEQVASVFGHDRDWLSSSVDDDPELSNYLREQLSVGEIRIRDILRRLDRAFLERQTDAWIQELYAFLSPQRALVSELDRVPIIRLQNGSHVKPSRQNDSRVFLPTQEDTGYRTVRRSVCESKEAVTFLRRLGLREWSQIDDLIDNVLPRHRSQRREISDDLYADDILRMARVWKQSDADGQRRLQDELSKSNIVRVIDAGSPTTIEWCFPHDAYLASEQLRELFDGITGVRLVDTGFQALCDTDVTAMLKACGASDQLKAVLVENRSRFHYIDLMRMRENSSWRDSGITESRGERVVDWCLLGVEELLISLPQLETKLQCRKAELLWQMLTDVNPRQFEGSYGWFYYSERHSRFRSSFVVQLNDVAWVLNSNGALQRPMEVAFESLGWRDHEFLLSQIKFRSPILEELASAAGVGAEAIQWLKNRIDEGTFEEIQRSYGGSRSRSAMTRIHSDRESAEQDLSERQDFAMALLERQTSSPMATAAETSVLLPLGGPKTRQSATTDRNRARDANSREGWMVKEVSYSERGPEGKALADEFRAMVEGDYGRRCQICGKTFVKSDGSQQVFIVHVVPPTHHSSSNYFGNLMGLCGWHFALLQHGEWCLRTLEGDEPVEEQQQVRALILGLPAQIDDVGNTYRGLPIRFWNVYAEWTGELSSTDAIVRYSTPHWLYLCELLKDDPMESS